RQAFGGDIIVTKNIVTDQHDEVVLTTYTTLVGRSGGDIDPNLNDAVRKVLMHGLEASMPDHTPRSHPAPPAPAAEKAVATRFARAFDEVSGGDELPARIVRLTRGDLVNYAGVSGDANPIHWSDEVVKLVDLETCVGHGMLSMGLGGGFVTSWLGNPGA